ncbi:MAG: threonine synthase [Syntrophomonadaceae bacterium]|nr:threonine synthase [Syntrophomonadaceae bacterium]
MHHVKYLECVRCGHQHLPLPNACTCQVCSGILEVKYDYGYISKQVNREYFKQSNDYTMWRYLPYLPVLPGSLRPPLRIGWTPLYRPQFLAASLGLEEIFIKDDGQNPTASLKDRATAIALLKAVEAGQNTIACSSTGNAASSLAGNAASMGMKSYIFVPGRAPQGKIAQLLIFGAHVISVQGSYQEAFELSAKAIARWGWYNRNAAINPYLVEGKKTVTMEICEQLDWQVPDWVVFSVGDGCTIAGAWKGFLDFYQTGLIDRLPKMLGVQAAGCCPLSQAFHTGGELVPMAEDTLADSIAVGVPRNPDKALRAVRDSGGTMVNVTDAEILAAMRLLGRTSGVFAEPAGSAALAGLKKMVEQGQIKGQDRVVVCVTGNGLKDVQSGIKAAGEPYRIEPDLEQLIKLLEKID